MLPQAPLCILKSKDNTFVSIGGYSFHHKLRNEWADNADFHVDASAGDVVLLIHIITLLSASLNFVHHDGQVCQSNADTAQDGIHDWIVDTSWFHFWESRLSQLLAVNQSQDFAHNITNVIVKNTDKMYFNILLLFSIKTLLKININYFLVN